MNFKYEVANMDIIGENSTVIHLHYRVSAIKDGCDLIAVRSGVAKLDEPGDTFVPFDQITKDLSVKWLKEKLDCPAIEQNLTDEIDRFVPEQVVETTSKLPPNWA